MPGRYRTTALTLLFLVCLPVIRQARGQAAPAPQPRAAPQRASGERVIEWSELRELLPRTSADLATVGATGVERVATRAGVLRLARGQMLAFREGAAPEAVTGPIRGGRGPASGDSAGSFYALPFRYLAPAAEGGAMVVLRPVYMVGRALRYDGEDGFYRGSFYLALEDTARPSGSRSLPAPVRIQFVSEADSVAPEQVRLDHTNFPLEEVAVLVRRARDSVRVRIVPEFDLRGVDVWLTVEPRLVIRTPPRVQGLGVQTTALTVAIEGATIREPIPVTLTADRGSLETNHVVIEAGGSASVRLRSGGIGPASVRAFAPALDSVDAVVQFVWPVIFLVAALLGGAFGGLAKGLRDRRNGRPAPLRGALVRGIVFGLLAALAYFVLGVNLLQIGLGVKYENEAAVFAFAALAAWGGIPLARSMSRMKDGLKDGLQRGRPPAGGPPAAQPEDAGHPQVPAGGE